MGQSASNGIPSTPRTASNNALARARLLSAVLHDNVTEIEELRIEYPDGCDLSTTVQIVQTRGSIVKNMNSHSGIVTLNPMQCAARFGKHLALEYLVQKFPNGWDFVIDLCDQSHKRDGALSPLVLAADGDLPGHLECIKYLLDIGADINAKGWALVKTAHGIQLQLANPLARACLRGNLECMNLLLERNAFVHGKHIRFASVNGGLPFIAPLFARICEQYDTSIGALDSQSFSESSIVSRHSRCDSISTTITALPETATKCLQLVCKFYKPFVHGGAIKFLIDNGASIPPNFDSPRNSMVTKDLEQAIRSSLDFLRYTNPVLTHDIIQRIRCFLYRTSFESNQ